MPLSMFPQSGGAAGVQQTLAHMVRLANGAMLDALIRDQAVKATSGCFRTSKDCMCYSLLTWVMRTVRYVADPYGVEMLHDPRLIARGIAERRQVYGDCDDMSTYLAALLKSIGLRPSFRAVGYDGKPFQHVYVVCEGLKLDATKVPGRISYRPNAETIAIEKEV